MGHAALGARQHLPLQDAWCDSPTSPRFRWPGVAPPTPEASTLGKVVWSRLQQSSSSHANFLLSNQTFWVKTMAESRSDYVHVPLYLGKKMHALAANAPTQEKGTPGKGPPPCPVAGDIFSSFLSQRPRWKKAHITLNASQRRIRRGASGTAGVGAHDLPEPTQRTSACQHAP